MRIIISTILLFFSLVSFGQAPKTTTIKLFTGDCRSNKAYSWYSADTIIFYKLPEGNISFKVIQVQYKQFPITLENLPISSYNLTYINNYGQLVSKQIELVEQPINLITICPDILLEYPKNSMAKLQVNDSILIRFHSQGCFHTTASKVSITKEAENYVARLYNVNWYYSNKKRIMEIKFRGDSLLKTVTLTNKNIQDFIRFENELNYINDGGCTTTDWYDIKSKLLNIKKTDGSCSWNGFYYLRKSFFGD